MFFLPFVVGALRDEYGQPGLHWVSGGNYSSQFATGCYAKLSGLQFFLLVNFSVRPTADA
jgi:hypothetical protein